MILNISYILANQFIRMLFIDILNSNIVCFFRLFAFIYLDRLDTMPIIEIFQEIEINNIYMLNSSKLKHFSILYTQLMPALHCKVNLS